METLISQRRVSSSNSGQDKEGASTIPRDRIPKPKSISFKEDKSGQKWFQGHFSGQTKEDYDSRDLEFATAVASAAFAIHSLEETDLQYQKRMRESLENSKTKVKSRKDETAAFPSSITRRFSNKETANPGQSSMKKPMECGNKEPESLNRIILPPPPPRQNRTGTRADAWERNKMEKIRKRYEKLKSSILAWENEKKMHGKLHMEKKKVELERKRAQILQHYQDNLVRVDKIAGGARTQLEEKRRNEEKEVRETAKKIRSTGRYPVSCFFFQYH